MKKFLTVLFGLIFLQNAYSDSLDEFSEEMYAFVNDKMDEAALRELCKKLVVYAWVRNIDILAEVTKDSGKRYINVTSDTCEKTDVKHIPNLILLAAYKISENVPEKHSQCVQNAMKMRALRDCAGMMSSQMKYLMQQGINVVFTADKTIIDCSETDNRCVVNRPVSKGGVNNYYSVCCGIEVISCEGNNVTYGPKNDLSTGIFVPEALTLKDYDYACQPINKK